jgi:organic hydroperoxide reductase OsmC/OhrA
MQILYRTRRPCPVAATAMPAPPTVFSTSSSPSRRNWASGQGDQPRAAVRRGLCACFDGAIHFLPAEEAEERLHHGHRRLGIVPAIRPGFALDVELTIAISGLPRRGPSPWSPRRHQVLPYSNALKGNVPVRLKTVAG